MSGVRDETLVPDTRELLLTSARREIETNGILGLRVADVAANAHFSVSVIYRHFGDRDGLLAAVLGDMYEEILAGRRDKIATAIPSTGPITVDHLIDAIPMPSENSLSDEIRLRLQILAVASTNPDLEKRISAVAQRSRRDLEWFLDAIRGRMTDHADFDARVFTVMVVNQMLYYNSLLGDYAVDDDAYREFLRDKLVGR